MSHDLCPVCSQWVYELRPSSDLPLPYNRSLTGQRYHAGCVDALLTASPPDQYALDAARWIREDVRRELGDLSALDVARHTREGF